MEDSIFDDEDGSDFGSPPVLNFEIYPHNKTDFLEAKSKSQSTNAKAQRIKGFENRRKEERGAKENVADDKRNQT